MMSQHRREFLKITGLGFLAAWIGNTFSSRANAQAGGAKLEMVKESDPMAKSLGYYEDAGKVDTKKWPKRAGADGKKQYCYNCTFYKASGDPKASKSAPCTIFANKGVAAKGWCNSWTQNAAVKG